MLFFCWPNIKKKFESVALITTKWVYNLNWPKNIKQKVITFELNFFYYCFLRHFFCNFCVNFYILYLFKFSFRIDLKLKQVFFVFSETLLIIAIYATSCQLNMFWTLIRKIVNETVTNFSKCTKIIECPKLKKTQHFP